MDHNLAVVLRNIPGLFLTLLDKMSESQDPTRLIRQSHVSRVHNRPASSAFVQAHRGLPSNFVLDVACASVEILGDHVLTTVIPGRDVCCFYLVSWKSGVVTLVSHNLIQRLRHLSTVTPLLTFSFLQLREIELSNRWTPCGFRDSWTSTAVQYYWRIAPISKFARLSSQKPPRMHTACSLESPALEPCSFVVVSTIDKEWVPTLTRGDAQGQLRRKRAVPFRTSRVGMIGLVEYEM